jgi:hypothetical protein
MTLQPGQATVSAAVIDGVDVDAVTAVVQACAGVAALDGGPFGETGSYLPGRIVPGVVVSGGRVKVQIRMRWGTPAKDLAALISTVLVPLTGSRPVDVMIADIDDPPAVPPANVRPQARPSWLAPGLPPA